MNLLFSLCLRRVSLFVFVFFLLSVKIFHTNASPNQQHNKSLVPVEQKPLREEMAQLSLADVDSVVELPTDSFKASITPDKTFLNDNPDWLAARKLVVSVVMML